MRGARRLQGRGVASPGNLRLCLQEPVRRVWSAPAVLCGQKACFAVLLGLGHSCEPQGKPFSTGRDHERRAGGSARVLLAGRPPWRPEKVLPWFEPGHFSACRVAASLGRGRAATYNRRVLGTGGALRTGRSRWGGAARISRAGWRGFFEVTIDPLESGTAGPTLARRGNGLPMAAFDTPLFGS